MRLMRPCQLMIRSFLQLLVVSHSGCEIQGLPGSYDGPPTLKLGEELPAGATGGGTRGSVIGYPECACEFPENASISLHLEPGCFDCDGDVIPLREGWLSMVGEGPCTIRNTTCLQSRLPVHCDFEYDLNEYGSCLFQFGVTTEEGYTLEQCYLVALFDRVLTEDDETWFDETWQACQDSL